MKQDSLRDLPRRSGAAVLVSNDPQFVSGFSKTQHRLEEIIAELAVNPCGAENNVVLERATDRFLAGDFAAAIGADRTNRIGFHIRVRFTAVEHVIG